MGKNRKWVSPNLLNVQITQTPSPPSRRNKMMNPRQNSNTFQPANIPSASRSQPPGPPKPVGGVWVVSPKPDASNISRFRNPSHSDSALHTLHRSLHSNSTLPGSSNHDWSVMNEPPMITKPLNIDEFGNMDSDSDGEDIVFPFLQDQNSKRPEVNDDVDGVPISESMILSGLSPHKNFVCPQNSRSKSSDLTSREMRYASYSREKFSFPEDTQDAMQSFIEALKDPESFKNKSRFMQTPISSLVEEMSGFKSNKTGLSDGQNISESDRRTGVQCDSRSKYGHVGNQNNESRFDGGNQTRRNLKDFPSKSSKGSKKDERKLKLSWHVTPVDRRKGEIEEQDSDNKSINSSIKGLTQTGKHRYGEAKLKEGTNPSVSQIFTQPSDMEEDEDEEYNAPTKNIIIDNERGLSASTSNQHFLQNTIGMPSNTVFSHGQGFLNEMDIGNVMVSPSQGFMLNNPEQRFLQNTGLGLAGALLPPGQGFIQNTNLGPSGMQQSPFQSIQGSWGSQEALMFQNNVMCPPNLQGIAPSPMITMSQQSMPTKQTMGPSATQNKSAPIPPSSFTQGKRGYSRFSPATNQNQTSSTPTNLVSPTIVNPSVPPPVTPGKPLIAAQNDINKSTTLSPSVNEVMMKLAPDGSGCVKYPAPDTNLLTFDPEIGYRYDAQTGLHYDANSGYFFNSKLKVFLFWDLFTQTYLRVENPSIPFPVFRNQNQSSDDSQQADLAGSIIDMKKLIEQHRQLKAEKGKTNQDPQNIRSSRSRSRDRDNINSRSRKRNASPIHSHHQKKRQHENVPCRRASPTRRASRSPKNGGRRASLTRRASRSPKNEGRRASPTHRASRSPKNYGRRSSSPSSRRRLSSPESSTRKRSERQTRGEIPTNRNPTGTSKRRSFSPRRRNEGRSRSPDKRQPFPRSPPRRRSHSKSPPGLSSRRKDSRNRSKSPANDKRHPVSRSPLKNRSRSLSPSRFLQRRSLSPGSVNRRREERRKRSRAPDRKPKLPKNTTTQPSLKVTVMNPIAGNQSIECVNIGKQESQDTSFNDNNVPVEEKFLGHQNNKDIDEEREHKATSPEKLKTGKSNDNCRDNEVDKNESTLLPKGKAIICSDKIQSSDSSTDKKNEKHDVKDLTKTIEKQSTGTRDISGRESESATRRRPRSPLEASTVRYKANTSKLNDDKSKSMRRNSRHDKQKKDEKQNATKNDSRDSSKRYASHRGTKAVDVKLEKKDQDNYSRSAKHIQLGEHSPTNEGRNHRLASERQFTGIGNKFSFPTNEISQSKPRPSNQFSSFISVNPVEDDRKLKSDLSTVPVDLDDFVVLDGIEDEEEECVEESGNDVDMTEEDLQLLLADDNDSNCNDNNESKSNKQQAVPSVSLLNKAPSDSTTGSQNEDGIFSLESAIGGLLKETPSIKTGNENENPIEITAMKATKSHSSQMNKFMFEEEKLPEQPKNSYSQPPSPASSIYSSYNFSDDDNFVTVSAVQDGDVVSSDEETNMGNKQLEGHSSKQTIDEELQSTEVSMQSRGQIEDVIVRCSEDISNKDTEICSSKNDSPSSVDPDDTVVSRIDKSSIGDKNTLAEENSDLKQKIKPYIEGNSIENEKSLKLVGGANGTTQSDGSELMNKNSSQDKDTYLNVAQSQTEEQSLATMSGAMETDLTQGQEEINEGGMRSCEKVESPSPEIIILERLNEEHSRCSSLRESIMEESPQVREPNDTIETFRNSVKEDSLQQDKRVGEKEEKTSPEASVLELLNEEQSRCSTPMETAKEETPEVRNHDEVATVSENDREATLLMGKQVIEKEEFTSPETKVHQLLNEEESHCFAPREPIQEDKSQLNNPDKVALVSEKEEKASPETKILELLNEEQSRCFTPKGSIEEDKPQVNNPDMVALVSENEEKACPETKILELLNEEQRRCFAPKEPVKEEKSEIANPDISSAISESDKKGKKVGGIFSRLGERIEITNRKNELKDHGMDNRVPGDTDQISKLYGNTPTCIVHLKTSVENFPLVVRSVRESIYKHLKVNGISYKKVTVYYKNALGCPFDYIQVTFDSEDQAKLWFQKTGRKIILQHTSKVKAYYFMYYAEPFWACQNCGLHNVFFRSLCFKCFYHKSGSPTNVRFTDEPSMYIGVPKIGISVDETNVLEHLNISFRSRYLRSIRIIDDPEMNCCCGLVVLEFSNIAEGKHVFESNMMKGIRYIEIDDDTSDFSTLKVSFRYAILTELIEERPNSDAGKSRVRSRQRNIQEIEDVEERPSVSSSRRMKDNVRSRTAPSLSPSNSIDEIGFPHDFDISPYSHVNSEESLRVVEYDSCRDSPERELDPPLTPLRYESDVRASRFENYGDSVPREFGDDEDVHHRSRERIRSRSPINRSISPPHRHSSQRYHSPPSRISREIYGSPPCRASPRGLSFRRISPRRISPRRISPRRISPRRISPRRLPPRRLSPRRHSPRRLSPRGLSPRRHSPRRYSPRRYSPHRSPPPRERSLSPIMSTSDQAPIPDGRDNGWIYPLPDSSRFKFEPIARQYYDPVTKLYYEHKTGLFYNSYLNIRLEYDRRNSRYVRVD